MHRKRSLYYLKAFGFSFLKENNKKNYDINNFENLNNKIKNCKLCHFSKNRHKLVMDKYKINTKIMIVLNNLSKEENESGKILNSKEGLALKNYLKIFFNINQIYITYIYKCFSCKNDDMSLNACLPYLFDEIKIIKPKVLLCIGKESFSNIGLKDFENLKGEFLNFNGIDLISTYDINHIEKNPSLEKDFLNTLYKIKGKI